MTMIQIQRKTTPITLRPDSEQRNSKSWRTTQHATGKNGKRPIHLSLDSATKSGRSQNCCRNGGSDSEADRRSRTWTASMGVGGESSLTNRNTSVDEPSSKLTYVWFSTANSRIRRRSCGWRHCAEQRPWKACRQLFYQLLYQHHLQKREGINL